MRVSRNVFSPVSASLGLIPRDADINSCARKGARTFLWLRSRHRAEIRFLWKTGRQAVPVQRALYSWEQATWRGLVFVPASRIQRGSNIGVTQGERTEETQHAHITLPCPEILQISQ